MKYDFSYVRPSQGKALASATAESCFSEQKLECISYDNAYILPHQGNNVAGVATSELEFIPSTGLDGNEQRAYDGKSAKYRDEVAIYLGCFHWVWGHFLTDNIKRFWFLYTDQCKQLIASGAKLVYTCVYNREVSANGAKLMAMADVDPSVFEVIKTPTQFRTLYIPDPAIIHSDLSQYSLGKRFYTAEFADTIQRIVSKIPTERKYDKIYLTRTGIVSNYLREFGEWKIERIFRQKGYQILRPEQIGLEEQLSILHNCTHFATTEGSIAHNAIFCKPGTDVVVIRKADYINSYQLFINQMRDLNVTYIDAHHTTPPYGEGHIWFGPFYMCVTEYLLRWAGLRNILVPWFMRPSYWWYQLYRMPFFEKYVSNRKIVHIIAKWYWVHCCEKNN